jgi:hypothetical protein
MTLTTNPSSNPKRFQLLICHRKLSARPPAFPPEGRLLNAFLVFRRVLRNDSPYRQGIFYVKCLMIIKAKIFIFIASYRLPFVH